MCSKFYIFIVIIFSLTLSCTRKYSSPQEFEGKVLKFGAGGGFTGKSIQYAILENGQLFEVSNDSTYLNFGSLDSKSVEQMFLNYSNYKFNELKINEPGNRYFFIIDNFSSKNHRLTWGGNELKSPILEVFYENAMGMITKQLNKKKND
jgi:hypothetical protein